jgi:putative transposase
MDDRKAMTAIFYLLRTGCQWSALPKSLGAKSTVYDRFQFWIETDVFLNLWKASLLSYDQIIGIEWSWQAMDGAQVLAPLAGEDTGPSYKHHFKTGTNRSLLTEGKGIPIGVVIAGANCNDFKLFQPTLEAIAIERPTPDEENPQHLCLDKGYDNKEIDKLVEDWSYTGHIRRRGENSTPIEPHPKKKPKRWVVERTHAWMNFFRRLKIRWEKKSQNYLGLIHFACAWITFRATLLF